MRVNLLHYTPLEVADKAISKCWDTTCKSGDDMKARIYRVGNKNKHSSTLEHINYSFDIEGISRACLQELARHRHTSMSVKSTRYTLKELKKIDAPLITQISKEEYEKNVDCGALLVEFYCNYYSIDDNIVVGDIMQQAVGEQYIVTTSEPKVNIASILALENIRLLIRDGISNDLTKFALPEAYKTSLVWTVNARSLQNFLSLRTDKAALWEIRDLANEIFNQLPGEHKYLFKEFVKEYEKEKTNET